MAFGKPQFTQDDLKLIEQAPFAVYGNTTMPSGIVIVGTVKLTGNFDDNVKRLWAAARATRTSRRTSSFKSLSRPRS